MTAAEIARARVLIYQEWIRWSGLPYFWGGKDPVADPGLDCSGLFMLGWRAAGVSPFGTETDINVAMIAASGLAVPWEERAVGDGVLYGENGKPSHIMGCCGAGFLIGAVHGGPRGGAEPGATYKKRMAASGAKVSIIGERYWESRRIGVVRAPAMEVT